MNKIFRFTLLTAVSVCISACSTSPPATAQQAEAQNSVNSFATQLANALPTGAVNNSAGQAILPTTTTTSAQQTSLVQAILAQQQGHLTPAQQAAIQQYLATHTQQQPQQAGLFNKNTSIFNKNTTLFSNNNTVFTQNTAIWNKQTAATTTTFHPFLGLHHFLHNLLNPNATTTTTTTTTPTTPTTPANTSSNIPWLNGFSAF